LRAPGWPDFPLFHARIAAEQAFTLEAAAQGGIDLEQCTRDSQPHRASLTVGPPPLVLIDRS
jgi:hypothetical protein